MTKGTRDWCLVTDIDGTLIGIPDTSRLLRERVLEARAAAARKGVRLRWVIATGRERPSCDEVLLDQGFRLDDFDAFVTSVGAELFFPEQSEPDVHYDAKLAASGFSAALVREVLAELAYLELQPDHEQRTHKVSYRSPREPSVREEILAALRALPFETETVFSHDSYLDVAPNNGTKAGAVNHLLSHWGIGPEHAVAAGDSGNDRSMLTADWYGIVVGNGHNELADLRGRQRLYFANERYAAGILEGLLFHGFLV